MMIHGFILTILTLLQVIFNSNAQNVDDRCYKIPLIENYDQEKVLGTWYLQEVGDEDEAHKRCIRYVLTSDHNKIGAVLTIPGIYNDTKKKRKIDNYKLYEIGNTSQYELDWKGTLRSGWVVATDYKTWSAYYICIPEENDKGILFIATRSRQPNEATKQETHDVLGKIGLNVSKPYLQVLNQTGCN